MGKELSTKRLETMMVVAYVFMDRSSCARLRVGCVITNLEMTEIVAYGYNGNYRGGPNDCDDSEAVGGCGCIHAESNALIKAPYRPGELIIFITASPCERCAKKILNAGIHIVVYDEEYRDRTGIQLLKKNGVTVIQIEPPYYPFK